MKGDTETFGWDLLVALFWGLWVAYVTLIFSGVSLVICLLLLVFQCWTAAIVALIVSLLPWVIMGISVFVLETKDRLEWKFQKWKKQA